MSEEQPDVALESRLESWQVRFRCPFSGRWEWSDFFKARRADAAEKEAPAALAKLIRESAERCEAEARKFLNMAANLRTRAHLIEHGEEPGPKAIRRRRR